MAYIYLQKATDILRDENGYPYAWKSGDVVKKFNGYNMPQFFQYIQDNAYELRNCVAFSGSASLLSSANRYLAEVLQAKGFLK